MVREVASLSLFVACCVFTNGAFAQQEIMVTQAAASIPADGPKVQKQAQIPTLPSLPPDKGWYLLCTAESKTGGTAAEISGFGTLCVTAGKEARSLTRLVDFDSGKSLIVTLQPWAAGQHSKAGLFDIFVSVKVVALTDSEAHEERERLSQESKRNAPGPE